MTKRLLFPESEDRLEEFKNTLLSNRETIFNNEFNKITTREPLRDNMQKNVSRQTEIDPLAGSIMQELYDSIVHIPAQKLFEDLKTQCEKLSEELGDNRFYIYLSHRDKNCDIKSNMFLAIMSMALNLRLINNFVDFICGETPLHYDEVDPEVKDIVYIDDVTFSGKQVVTNITAIDDMELEDTRIHVVIPYTTPMLLSNIFTHEGLFLYTTDTFPTPVINVIHKLIAKHPRESVSRIREISSYLLRGNMYRSTLSLLYTDLKIADFVSIFTGFLLEPRYFNSSEKPLHIVSNCEFMERANEPVGSGNSCPYPIYKQDDWISTMKNLLSDGRDDKRTKN